MESLSDLQTTRTAHTLFLDFVSYSRLPGSGQAAVQRELQALVASTLTDPLSTWLSEWPATGGSSFERLQQVLRQVPALIRQLEQQVAAKS